jgi:hypothetical protein
MQQPISDRHRKVQFCTLLQVLWLLSASDWFLACIILWPWKWKRHVPPKRRLTLNGLRGVISQNIELSRSWTGSSDWSFSWPFFSVPEIIHSGPLLSTFLTINYHKLVLFVNIHLGSLYRTNSLRIWHTVCWSRSFPTSVGPEGSFSCSQELSSGPYPESVEAIPSRTHCISLSSIPVLYYF